jgi:hypothetical protein
MIQTISSKQELFRLTDEGKHLAILFTIDECNHCKDAIQLFEQLDQIEWGGYEFYTFNVTHELDVCQMYMLLEFPTVVLLYGTLIEKLSIGMGMIRDDCYFDPSESALKKDVSVISNGKTK